MDLIPTPGQVVTAAGNVAHKVLYGSVADLRTMPRTLIESGELREVFEYAPAAAPTTHTSTHTATLASPEGDPVLLVPPLAAPALCFDLRRGCSLVEHLVDAGVPTYLVEYGQVSYANRTLGMEHWVREVVPSAVRAVHERTGRPVHLVGWSLGGIFALLAAADSPDLPLASVVAFGSPVDVSKVPLIAPMRPLLNLAPVGALVTRGYQAMGGIPVPVVGWGFAAASVHKLLTKPLVMAANLDDKDLLAQLEAVERFMSSMHAYPGRSFGQLFHRMVKGNALADGSLDLGGKAVTLADVRVPVLALAGTTDGIAPVAAVHPVVDLLSGSPEVAFEVVPGGHLGMLTGRAARTQTWPLLVDWVRRQASPGAPAAAGPSDPERSIGTNRRRRHSSASSRNLAARKVPPAD